jgi:hypothetical protein
MSIPEVQKVKTKERSLCGGMEMDIVMWRMILMNVSVMS